MSYTPTNWVSGETPLSAENMNHIEQGISDLNSNLGMDSFLGARSGNVSAGTLKGTVDTSNKIVTIVMNFSNSTALNSSQVLFTIPSEYRPKTEQSGDCFIVTNTTGGNTIGQFSVKTNGQVIQTASNSALRGFGVIVYVL